MHQAIYVCMYVVADTTRLTCCYFIPIPPFLYCLDTKSVLTAFSYVEKAIPLIEHSMFTVSTN